MHTTASRTVALLLFSLAIQTPLASPTRKQWVDGNTYLRRHVALRSLLGEGRSIYLGKHGYFDQTLRWHPLPDHFNDDEIMSKPGVLAIYRSRASLAHKINVQLARRLMDSRNKTMRKHAFTHTGGRLSFHGHHKEKAMININGTSLPYRSRTLDVARLVRVVSRHFRKKPKHMWPHTRQLLAQAAQLAHTAGQLKFDEKKDQSAFFFYVFHAIYSAIDRDKELVHTTGPGPIKNAFVTSPLPLRVSSRRHTSRFAFSVVPFWRNDLDWQCERQLRRGIAMGFQRVALFYPVHYSVQKRNGRGSQYRYLKLASIGQGEVDRCLRRIMNAGLELHWIPHLEDAKTIISNWEVEWRINGGIPIDKKYSERAFEPLFRFLKANPKLVRRWSHRASLRVTIAAELDRMVFMRPRSFGREASRLKSKLRRLTGRNVPIVWNPNGDLHAVIGDAKRTPAGQRCRQLADAMSNIDAIAPTIYEQYKHIGQTAPGVGIFVATRRKFTGWLQRATKFTCPKAQDFARLTRQWQRLISRDFSFGEVALNPNGTNSYRALHRDFVANGGGTEMILWTAGAWDAIGISRMHIPNPVHQQEILDTLKPRQMSCRTQLISTLRR